MRAAILRLSFFLIVVANGSVLVVVNPEEVSVNDESDNQVVDDHVVSTSTAKTTVTRASAYPSVQESSNTLLRILSRLHQELESINKQMDGFRTAFLRLESDFREEISTLHEDMQGLKSAASEVESAVQTNDDTLDRVLEWTTQADATFKRLERAAATSALCRAGGGGGGGAGGGGRAAGGATKRKKKNKATPQGLEADAVGFSNTPTYPDDIDQQMALLTKPQADGASPSTLCDVSNATKEMQRIWGQLKGTWSPKPSSCSDVQKLGATRSGVYAINPTMAGFDGYVRVFCDLKTDGGGWTVIQRRNDYGLPRENFSRTWSEYRQGFGDVQREFWLGNDVLYALTNQEPVILRVELHNFENERRFAVYNHFRVAAEQEQFRLYLGAYRGDAADSLSRSRGMNFSTVDADNDMWNGNCAKRFKGGWWFNNCHDANLNGFNHGGKHESYADGINWYHWKGFHYSLKRVEMKIRSLGFAEDGPQELPAGV